MAQFNVYGATLFEFSPSEIQLLHDGPIDGDGRTDGHILLKSCENAENNSDICE